MKEDKLKKILLKDNIEFTYGEVVDGDINKLIQAIKQFALEEWVPKREEKSLKELLGYNFCREQMTKNIKGE